MFPVSIPRIFKNVRRAFVTKSLFSRVKLYSSVENSITCIGILQEVPLLLPQSTGCNANKTPSNKIHFLKYAFKTSENLKGKISKNLCFCKNRHEQVHYRIAALNSFSENSQEGVQVYFKRILPCMFY